MSQDHPAVPLGAADIQIAEGGGAHDTAQDDAGAGWEAVREPTRAFKASSVNLESPTMEGSIPPAHDLSRSHTRLQAGFATDIRDEPCVTAGAHDTANLLLAAINGIHEPDQGESPSEPAATCIGRALL